MGRGNAHILRMSYLISSNLFHFSRFDHQTKLAAAKGAGEILSHVDAMPRSVRITR